MKWSLAALAVLGCCGGPSYTVYPAQDIASRLADDKSQWTRELKAVHQRVRPWTPNEARFAASLTAVAGEYGRKLPQPEAAELLRSAKALLVDEESLGCATEGAANGNGEIHPSVATMLRRIDGEHERVLAAPGALKRPPESKSPGLLSLLSWVEPAAVSVTPTGADRSSGEPAEPPKPPDPAPAAGGGPAAPASPKAAAAAAPGAPAGGAAPGEKPPGTAKPGAAAPVEDEGAEFDPEQVITISVSTVLNSPGILDRIEYVSTYLYLFPFPYPPNGRVVLENEFWRNFFSLQNPRGDTRAELRDPDLFRALESMRIRIVEVETTVKSPSVQIGESKNTRAAKATVGLTTAYPFTFVPALGGEASTTAEFSQKIVQQLDQRSTYLSPGGNFLRITQRGMQAVNLSGRFTEKLTLRVPAAHDRITVLVPYGEGLTRREFQQPVYSRVDALSVSVLVVRNPSALTKSAAESYKLEDNRPANLVAWVTRPCRVSLWRWGRTLYDVTHEDALGSLAAEPFASLVLEDRLGRVVPLRVSAPTAAAEARLLSMLRKAEKKPGVPAKLKDAATNEDFEFGAASPEGAPNPKIVPIPRREPSAAY